MAKRTVKKAKLKLTGHVRAPRASRYLYVEARGWFTHEDTVDGNTVPVFDGPISFDSIVVAADDEQTAYVRGGDALTARQQDESDNYVQEGEAEEDGPQVGEIVEGSHCSGDFLNDYVVKL